MLNSGIIELEGMRVYVDTYMNEDQILVARKGVQQDVINKIMEASNAIAKADRASANYIITSQKVADVIKEIGRDIPKEKRAALRKKLNKIKK